MSADLETLPARRHFSATLDPSFGANGVATLASGTSGVLPVSDGIFVRYDSGGETTIGKLTSDGKSDFAWGDHGVARVPFDAVDAWAYDARLHRLVVGGHYNHGSPSPPVSEAKVLRLSTDGKPDSTFGEDGVYTYTPSRAASENADPSAFASVQTLTVLPHGRLLIGLSRGQSTFFGYNDSDGGPSSSSTSVSESTLLKLRGNGTRDVAFGRRGVRSVAFDDAVSRYDFGESFGRGQASILREVTPDATGDFVVTLTVKADARYENATTDFRFDVVNRRVKADGTLDSAADVAWTLVNSHDPSGYGHITSFDFSLAQPTATGLRVVGRSSRNNALSTPLVFDLEPGERPVNRSVKVPAGGTLEAVVPIRRGYLIIGQLDTATGAGPYVSLLNARLRPDVRWGDGGLIFVPDGSLTFDPAGRVIVTENDRISRFLVTITV